MRKFRSPREIGDYIVDEGMMVGRGTYGKIYVAYKKDVDQKLACKCISKKSLHSMAFYNIEMMTEVQTQFEREIHFHFKLSDNKHIVRLLGMEQDELSYFLFMEFCDSDLGKLLQKRGKLPEAEALELLRQLCLGYNSIYRNNASHRDLKPQNLLLKKGQLKIADFGFVKELSNLTDSVSRSKLKLLLKDKDMLRTSTLCGTPDYIPPNAVELPGSSLKYDPEKFDMWSIGVILYFMLYGQRPFTGSKQSELYEAIQKKQVVFPESENVSAHSKQLIMKLLNKDEQQRIGFKQLLKELQVEVEEVKQPEERKSLTPSQIEGKFESKIKFVGFLCETMNMLYSVNTKFNFFKKHFKQIPFAYQIMTRMHEMRKARIVYIESIEGFAQISEELKEQFKKLKEKVEEYERFFYEPIKAISSNIERGFSSLEMLLKRYMETMKTLDPTDLQSMDFGMRKCFLALLRLKLYVEKKLKQDKLLEVLSISQGSNITQLIKQQLTTE